MCVHKLSAGLSKGRPRQLPSTEDHQQRRLPLRGAFHSCNVFWRYRCASSQLPPTNTDCPLYRAAGSLPALCSLASHKVAVQREHITHRRTSGALHMGHVASIFLDAHLTREATVARSEGSRCQWQTGLSIKGLWSHACLVYISVLSVCVLTWRPSSRGTRCGTRGRMRWGSRGCRPRPPAAVAGTTHPSSQTHAPVGMRGRALGPGLTYSCMTSCQ